jgi:cyclase
MVTEMGAGEILLTSMDRDGTTDGYDIELTRAVSDAVTVPLIASGGAGTPDHLADAVDPAIGAADAALAASVFHFGRFSVSEAKRAMAARNLPVRIPRP